MSAEDEDETAGPAGAGGGAGGLGLGGPGRGVLSVQRVSPASDQIAVVLACTQ
ncbi:hypothetical protein [Nocardia abscessus]|uniref:hypothetical protein n=1 Tax=Nocardia abscessus TaxID=120957 RepID=UPI00313B6FB4